MLFETSTPVMIFFALQNGIYLAILVPIALARFYSSRSPARIWALVALLLCLVGLFTIYVMPAIGLYSGPLFNYATQLKQSGGGLGLPIGASLALVASTTARGRNWPWLDWVHAVVFVGFLLLWAWVSWF